MVRTWRPCELASMTDVLELSALRPQDVSVARLSFARQLEQWRCRDAADAVLVFSELVSNAVTYAGGAHRIVVRREGSSIRLEVHDDGAGGLSQRRSSDPFGGRGLSIVDRLSTRWGWQATQSGKVVWAILPCGG